MASETGKRYACTSCGSQFMATKGGTGQLTCCGKPVERQ